jgi:Asp-tRNA(Asn)/Glu-tRNA(Gln) amidotransferase A subunit family amidase
VSTDLVPWGTATDLTAALRRRELSSRELLEAYLDRVARLGARVNAVVTLDERAPDEAAAGAAAAARGGWRGPGGGVAGAGGG